MKSLRIKLVSSFLTITVLLAAILLFSSIYAIGTVRTQASAAYSNMVSLYLEQIDLSLSDVESYLSLAITYDENIYNISQSRSKNTHDISQVALARQLQNDIMVYKIIDCFFLYVPSNSTHLAVNNNSLSYLERSSIKTFIEDSIASEAINLNAWKVYKNNDNSYLIRILELNDLYLGAWIKADHLETPMSLVDFGETAYTFFTAEDGSVLTPLPGFDLEAITSHDSLQSHTINGERSSYQFVAKSSRKGNFDLNVLIPDENTLNQLPAIRNFSICILLITILVIIPYGFFLIQKSTLIPLTKLVRSMKKVKNGDFSVRIHPYPTSSEFEVVNETFNSMVCQIQTLQSNVTQERSIAQAEELHRLQMQQNPHFLINSLNILYHLARSKDYALLEEMTTSLIRYFRFVFTNNLSFVQLKHEVEHCENYLHIQKLRFKDKLSYNIYLPDFLSDTPVPPLVIQTFVENSVKYAVTLDEPAQITVDIDFCEEEQEQCIKIIIEDTGKGFSTEQLMHLQSDKNLSGPYGEHMGILNVQRRIALLYKDKARLTFANRKGVLIEIILPMKADKD